MTSDLKPPEHLRVLETCLYVERLPRAEAFYGDLLGLEFVSRKEGRHVFFRCGNQMLLLFHADSSSDASSQVPTHGARGPGHVAFAIAAEHREAWQRHLEQHQVEIEQQMEWPNGVISLYFRDPDGNSLELASPKLWNLAEEDELAST